MWHQDLTVWTPGRHDTGQVDECSHERAVFRLFAPELSEEERCRRALRAVELERVSTEIRRAASAVVQDDWDGMAWEAPQAVHRLVANSRVATTIAALNLMGVRTRLPGEYPPGRWRDMVEGSRVYLREPDDDEGAPSVSDTVDALGGLIGDFRRSTIFLNGLRIEPESPASPDPMTLVAVHPAIMIAFGEFLAQKYIVEGWSLA
jgi:hypothetical protein